MRFKPSIIIVIIFSLLLVPASQSFAAQDEPAGDMPTYAASPSTAPETSLTREDEILIQSPQKRFGLSGFAQSYSVKTGGAVAIYDEDFRDFVDYGVSINYGLKKKVIDKLYFFPSIGFLMLKGDWDMSNESESILIESEEYFPGYSGDIAAEDINEVNYGSGYISEGEAVVTSAEFLRSIDLSTSLYIIPITLNVVYQPHEGGKKFNPYIGGGIGFCLARRDVESRVLKDKSFDGPQYRITLDDSETVPGQVLQFFAGFEIPFKKNIKLVAEATTTLYGLKNFEPILEIEYKRPNPAWYEGSDLLTWTLEDPIRIGVFQEEFVTSLSIGLVVPF